jgi:ACS family D-galactonate transporter-like MFS transporter
MQIPAGRLIDQFGEGVMFGASVLVWSVFTAATAGVSSFGALLGLRLGLGVGEAGAYPAAAKTVSHWFPLRLRGRATSVYDSGARIGSAAATPIIAPASSRRPAATRPGGGSGRPPRTPLI